MNTKAECSCKGKSLDHFLQPTILMLLSEEEMHGFLLLKRISETPLFAGEYPDPTGLYRFLKKMEGLGMLASREEEQENVAYGRSYREAPEVDGQVFIEGCGDARTGDMMRVRVSQGFTYDVVGEPED